MPHTFSPDPLTKLVEGIAAAVFETDPQGNATRLSGWAAMTGQGAAETHDNGWLAAIHPDDVQRAADAWKSALDHGIQYNTDFRIRTADGTYLWHNARGIPEFDAEGNVRKWIGMILRMTSRMRPASSVVANSADLERVETILPSALRAARAMLGWSAEDLATKADLSRSTIRRLESDDAQQSAHRGTLKLLVGTLSGAGLELLVEGNVINGVRSAPKAVSQSTVLPFPNQSRAG